MYYMRITIMGAREYLLVNLEHPKDLHESIKYFLDVWVRYVKYIKENFKRRPVLISPITFNDNVEQLFIGSPKV